MNIWLFMILIVMVALVSVSRIRRLHKNEPEPDLFDTNWNSPVEKEE